MGRAYERSYAPVNTIPNQAATETQTSASTINRSSHYVKEFVSALDLCVLPEPERHTQYPALEIFLDTRRRMTKIVGSMMKTALAALILFP